MNYLPAEPKVHKDRRTNTEERQRRRIARMIGLAAIAVVMSSLFAVVALAAWTGGEWILAAMSGIGAFVTLAVGLGTLIRG